MIELIETIHIDCGPPRVWSALTNPAEVVEWDTGVQQALDAPPDYPQPGQYVRWQYRLGPLPLTLHDRPSEVVPNKTLRSSIRLGPFAFDETYTLTPANGLGTELSALLRLWSPLPLIGGWIEIWPGHSLALATVRQSLEAIKAHCEHTAALLR